MRLLQRTVKVVIEGCAANQLPFGSILHPSGHNIAVSLVSEGLAKVTDWNLTTLYGSSAVVKQLREAEKKAKIAKLGYWKEYVLQKKMLGPEPE